MDKDIEEDFRNFNELYNRIFNPTISKKETVMNTIEIEICGCPCELDPWELVRWIVIKHREGVALHAEATCNGTLISGELSPHSIERTQYELTRTTLVDIHTPDGTVTCNCKHITKITLLHT